ncbi:hypothetical protein BJ508DRAFT_91844 [Ascobolus immersus RN42]|uniref:Uncharacterized protein n=1 Tax=Ascobolus immersus RN42 TaxID=1160509 RepID=A0A3N4HAA8_ASCIM|nr:hypothetical protein BJ508DRAFT_91844 [Ascobolus immersus RN42]
MSLGRPRSLSVSEMSDLPPALYPPPPEIRSESLQMSSKMPSRPHTSASTKRPIHTTRAFVVIGATQSSMAVLPPARSLVPQPSAGNPARSTPVSVSSSQGYPPLRRRKSSSTLDHLLKGTKTIEEHRRIVEQEIIRRNRAKEREKESGVSKLLGNLRRALISDEWEGAQVVYLTAKEAAEREWEIRSKLRSRAGVGLIQRF